MPTETRATSPAPASAELVVRAGACAALLGAGVVHATVVSEHSQEWALAGLFFAGLQVVQTVLAVAVAFWWDRRVAITVVVVNLATVAVWAVSRTAGLPFGPAGFQQPEAVGVADLACCFLELLAAGLALPTALGRGPLSIRWPRAAVGTPAAVSVVLLAVVLTGWGLTPTVTGAEAPGHQHGGHAEQSSHGDHH
jgi:hypothetical protein